MTSDTLKIAVASIADLADRQPQLVVDEKFNAVSPRTWSPPG